MYLILGSGVKQPWADGETNSTVRTRLQDSSSGETDEELEKKKFGNATRIQNSKKEDD